MAQRIKSLIVTNAPDQLRSNKLSNKTFSELRNSLMHHYFLEAFIVALLQHYIGSLNVSWLLFIRLKILHFHIPEPHCWRQRNWHQRIPNDGRYFRQEDLKYHMWWHHHIKLLCADRCTLSDHSTPREYSCHCRSAQCI